MEKRRSSFTVSKYSGDFAALATTIWGPINSHSQKRYQATHEPSMYVRLCILTVFTLADTFSIIDVDLYAPPERDERQSMLDAFVNATNDEGVFLRPGLRDIVRREPLQEVRRLRSRRQVQISRKTQRAIEADTRTVRQLSIPFENADTLMGESLIMRTVMHSSEAHYSIKLTGETIDNAQQPHED